MDDELEARGGVCVLQSNEAPKGRMRPVPANKGATKLKRTTSKSEFPPGQNVLYPKGRGPKVARGGEGYN